MGSSWIIVTLKSRWKALPSFNSLSMFIVLLGLT